MVFYPGCGGLYSYVLTCFEERLESYSADEYDEVEEFFLYFKDEKNFKMFLEEYCFQELDSESNLKCAIVNDTLCDEELLPEIQEQIKTWKEENVVKCMECDTKIHKDTPYKTYTLNHKTRDISFVVCKECCEKDTKVEKQKLYSLKDISNHVNQMIQQSSHE